MDFSVKTIFKTLIGTVAVMVIGSLVIEYMNMTIVSLQLTNISKLSARQAAVLFSQETYKERPSGAVNGGSVSLERVLTADGSLYIDGDVYVGSTPEQIYNNLYAPGDFSSWLRTNSAATKGNWKSLHLIDRALNGSLNLTPPTNMMAPNFAGQMDDYTESMLAKSYKDVMMTPLNMGVPYLDEDTVERMFKWNLAQIASDCNPDAIRRDPSGKYCVFYKGFRVYAQDAYIKKLDYKTFDLDSMADVQEFRELTSIEPNDLGYDDSLIQYLGHMSNGDERKRICVVGIEFGVPMSYEGVTPIKKIAEFAWNYEVEGLDGTGDNQIEGTDHAQWHEAVDDLESGGLAGNRTVGTLPVPGRLIYYVVR